MRALLLLLVLLVPHVEAAAQAGPTGTVVAECEHEVPVTPSRSTGRTVLRPDAPAPLPTPDPAPGTPRTRPAPTALSPAPQLRTVVLRC
ncbi:hypothetical protein [Streptomyces sp. LaPpAH-108]|uniref:hypothetical protein n=1 Tax=Streptomyces sp. LaPpAH-108 TaxID=1155714 RepID=UPI00037F2E39|nr:hypothetical protein [Streptomyces sp. LaPpAH-108]